MTTAYSYQIGGPPLPPDVSNFNVRQIGNNVLMSWANIDTVGVLGFDIYFTPQDISFSQSFESAILISEVTRATELMTSKIPPGSWTFWIVAKDLAGQTSLNPASVDFTVTNANTVIDHETFIPSYSRGQRIPFFSSIDFVEHYTGVFVPHGSETCDFYVPIAAPDTGDVTLDQVPGGTADAITYYFTFTYVTNGGETFPSAELSINVDAGFLPTVFIPASAFAASCEGWNVYCDTVSGSETLQNSIPQGFIPGGTLPEGQQDQIWQMPVTGLVAGAAQPTQDTTGWEVFNVFVPDPTLSQGFSAPLIDSGVTASKRVWLYFELVPGPGQLGINTDPTYLDVMLWSSDVNTFSFGNLLNDATLQTFYTLGFALERYILAEITAFILRNYVFYIRNFQMTIDNLPVTTPVTGVSISSAGTTVNFSTYGLTYHQPPNVQVTPSSGATGGNAGPVTSSDALVTVYTSTGAVAGVANLTITGI